MDDTEKQLARIADLLLVITRQLASFAAVEQIKYRRLSATEQHDALQQIISSSTEAEWHS